MDVCCECCVLSGIQGFEPTISAGERPYTYALDRAATGTGILEETQPSFHCLQSNQRPIFGHHVSHSLYQFDTWLPVV